MSDSDPLCPLAPPWLRPDIHAAMRRAYDRKVAGGHGPAVAVTSACAVLLARVTEAVTPPEDTEPPCEATASSSGRAPASGGAPRALDEADVADLVAALSYALRFDARGKPRKGGWDHAADLAAEWLAEHLKRSNFVVLKRPPGAPHRAG
ncbi:MAG: hypothetical protein ICV73_22335 [Acetobacteraceae bacterium]|nr:hypothetical protein [Acetobacteraceae bacterium]